MDLFNNYKPDDYFRKMNRLLFIDDLEKHRTEIVPISPEDFIHLFGEPTDEDFEIMTQILISDVHMIHNTHHTIIDKWGVDWIIQIMNFNVQKEEYELCAILRDMVEEAQDELIKKYI
jgi:hypothetical protein